MDTNKEHGAKSEREDLFGAEAIEKMRKLIDKSGSCFFVTRANFSAEHKSRPMAVQKTDETGAIWFLSPMGSTKNLELAADTYVTLYFQGSSFSDYLELNGQAVVSTDRRRIEELWDPTLSAWFPEGKNDPTITVIKFSPSQGYYWDNKNGNMIAGLKILFSTLSGSKSDDSVEGELRI